MKINDILTENEEREPKELTNDDFKTIINSKYFELNIEPVINKKESAEENINNIKKRILFHGDNGIIDYLRLEVRKIENRKAPRDTPVVLHNMVNDKLEEKFDVRLRNKLFVTNDRGMAKTFGKNISVVVPSDDYTLYASEYVKDFTYQVANTLFGTDSEFTRLFKKYFYESVNNNSVSFSKSYHNLEGFDKSKFDYIIQSYVKFIQLVMSQYEDTVGDYYNILSYIKYERIKERLKDFITDDYYNETIQNNLINNLNDLANILIEITNKTIREYFQKLINDYIESIYSFKQIPEDIGSKEIIVHASYGTYISMETFEKVIDYYTKEY